MNQKPPSPTPEPPGLPASWRRFVRQATSNEPVLPTADLWKTLAAIDHAIDQAETVADAYDLWRVLRGVTQQLMTLENRAGARCDALLAKE